MKPLFPAASALPRRRFLFLSAATCLSTIACNTRTPQTAETAAALTWEEAVAQAKGTTVNWAMWGGSASTNAYADGWVAEQLQSQYDVVLNRVPINDTIEAVNKVVGEVQAGLKSGGSIDLIWINGENFRTMKQGGLLYGPFTDKLPALAAYDLSNAAVLSDFGLPIDGYEAPYTGSYYLMAKDSAKVSTTPQNTAELLAWAKANPGRFTYAAPPAFDGSRFLLTALYGVSQGYEQYAGAEFDEALWNQNSPLVAAYLKELEPYLWREGQTYPPTQTRLQELFANGEITMMPAFVSQIAEGRANGQLPPSAEAFAMTGISLNDPSFTAIPINASNPAGAMVLANLLASPEGQLEKFDPQVWGDPPLLDVTKLSPELQAQFAQAEADYGIPLRELTLTTVPVVNAEYTTRLEALWKEQIAV
jgi:putative spermidine/putrescine transport system substrate-binding protein